MANIVVLFVVLFAMGYAGNLPWSWQNPCPEGNEYTDVCVIDENTIFVVEEEAGTILKSTDSGLTWDVSFTPYPDSQPGYYELYGIDFPDSLTGYAVGDFWGSGWNQTYHALIMKTTDQGGTWTFQYLGAEGTWLYDVDFPQGNNQVGYAVGRFGMILKTTNGGQSWFAQTSGTSNDIKAVHFPVDANTGYAVGGNNTTTPVLLKTTNGGTNWISQTSPASVTYWDVCFVDNQVGYAGGYTLGSGGNGTIIKTTNGGANWQQIWYQVYREIYSVHFLDSQTGYAGGWAHPNSGWSGSFIMKTTDGGGSWTPVFIPKFMTYVMPIDFANAQTGYAAGYVYDQNGGHGQLLKTTDAGATWNFLNTGPEAIFWAVDFLENGQIGYVVGDLGYILKTTNGGINWVQQVTGTGQTFYDIDFFDNQLGYAVGANGTFFKTTNGGNTWIPKNSGTTADLYAVRFVNPQVGYIGGFSTSGDGGVILKTTDGGDNWVSQTIPNNNYERAIQDIFFFDVDTGYAVAGAWPFYGGSVGLVYKTTNGGQTWVVNYAPSSANFYAIDFPENKQIGYISGLMGGSGAYKMIKTTDGGGSWTGQSLGDGIVPMVSVSFSDNLIGYAVSRPGGYNMMMKTTNGGTNWFAINSLTWHGYEDIFAVDANTVYAVGRGGMIRKTTNGGQVWIAEKEKDELLKVEHSNGLLVVYPNLFQNHCVIKFQIPNPNDQTNSNSQILPSPFSSPHRGEGWGEGKSQIRGSVALYGRDSRGQAPILHIYDASGRLVKQFNHLTNYQFNYVLWYGDYDSGRRLPAGVYFVRLESQGFKQVEKVILLR